jgi:hypothetical protein
MAASQPAAKFGVTDHHAETADAKEEIDNVKHALCSAPLRLTDGRNMRRSASSLDWEIGMPV